MTIQNTSLLLAIITMKNNDKIPIENKTLKYIVTVKASAQYDFFLIFTEFKKNIFFFSERCMV